MLSAQNKTNHDIMDEKKINPTAFHLIGRAAESGLVDIDGLELQPALYAGFTDLNKLRHDFPVVLDHYDWSGGYVRSLCDIVNDVLRKLAPPGVDGEFMRSQILSLEQEIRVIAAGDASISLAKAWDKAVRKLRGRASNGSLEALNECLEQVEDDFRINGQLIDCDADMPVALVRQAWAIDQKEKTQASRKRVDELILKLENILGAEIKKSEQTLLPENLKGSVGSSFESAFDFDAMSEILTPARPRDTLPEERRLRIQSILRALQSQRFFKSEKWSDKKGRRLGPHSFLFRNATSALRAVRNRVPEMAELTKAISMAELEIANAYEPSKHDPIFAGYDETSLRSEDMAQFPTYLITLNEEAHDAGEKAKILELLSSGLPVKILAQTDDILDGLTGSAGQLPFGGMSWQLASMAVALNNVFVLQSGGSSLYRLRDKIWSGLTCGGAALFSVFSGGSRNASGLSPYLVAAAATESRAFPTFVYDPSKGPDWASRLSIASNPQLENDWPVHTFSYEDENLQRLSEDITFTFIEFIASDKRFSEFFARVPKENWTDTMIPVRQYLETNPGNGSKTVPCVLMVDENHMLHKLVVDDRLIRIAHRCRDMWHSLQEMGGIHNSHALKLLKSERENWQAEKDEELAELKTRPAPEATITVSEEKPVAAPIIVSDEQENFPEPSSDEAFIETIRCTTCNECTDINSQMFGYNDDKQAHIVDPSAGTYRQLVEAAENCQVSIIHPGKPRDMSEPNLDELMERAAVFN